MIFLQGLAMVMHKNHEGQAVFEMLNKALEIACHEKRVTEERNIRILIAQMHVVKVIALTIFSSILGSYLVLKGKGLSIAIGSLVCNYLLCKHLIQRHNFVL